MIKNITYLLLVIPSLYYAQNGSIVKLKEGSDKARNLILSDKNTSIPPDPINYVNPFIGTGGHGHTYPGASAPFGMMQLSPDTRHDGWDGCGGYHYDDNIIYGFSHTHLSGTGVSDYADLLVIPQVGKPKIDPLFKDKTNGYGSTFEHNSEVAKPGYYSVKLKDRQIDVQLTVTEHAGMHRYTFHDFGEEKYLLLDLDYRDELISSSFSVLNNKEITGSRISRAWAEEQHFYFYLQTSLPFISSEKINKDGRHKLLLKFPSSCREIELRVGISAVDERGAKLNADTEIPDFSFEKVKAETTQSWRNQLSRIHFESNDHEILSIFYTALYHSFLNPNTFSDVDGRYRGMDMEIHHLPETQKKQYTVFSLWDTFRATHPLFTLTHKPEVDDFIKTFLNHEDQGNDLTVWELAANETECMIGYHSVSVIADAYHKGIRNFDAEKALEAMVKTARDSTYSKDFYTKNGYLSLAIEPESVSKILEYAYDDFCIATMAADMGKKEIAQEFFKRSFNFLNHFDPESHFFRARRDGQWMTPFKPEEVNFNYTEANAWQYSLFAPHAVGALKKIHGGERNLEAHLDAMFTANSETSGRKQSDITGLIGQYAHGNEPSHHMAYLYNYVGRPDKAQLYLDSIQYNLYHNKPDGLSGNEDCGQMSSWYVLSALGLYQIAPGNEYFDIGRPLAKKAHIYIDSNHLFEIECINQSRTNKYIQSITLNGKELNRLYISYSEIMKGGKLVFLMGPNPNGIVKNYFPAPTLSEIPDDFCVIPYFKNESRVFEGSTKVDIRIPDFLSDRTLQLEYNVDGGEWFTYTGPIYIDKNTRIEARTVLNAANRSGVVSTDFVLRNTDLTLDLKTPYVDPYTAGGKNALIDGITGNHEFRTGDWQGFYGKDVVAEITMKHAKKEFNLELGLLEDLKSWIFYPESIIIEVSYDGRIYKPYLKQNLNEKQNNYRPGNRKTVAFKIKSRKEIKSIRLTVTNPGNCPNWHLGAGNPSWLFLDEIVIKN
jgi:predicted alpha-1,2-mannosidase